MLEVLKDTDRRLAMTLGDRTSRWTKIILDKDGGRAWFERRLKFLPARTLTVALGDIVSIGTETITRGAAASGVIVVTTAAKAQFRFAGDTESTHDAAALMHAFVGLEGAAPPHVTRPGSALAHWGRRAVAPVAVLTAAAAVIALAITLGSFVAGKAGTAASGVAARLGGLFALPACDAPASRDTILELVCDRLGPSATLANIVDAGASGGERLCRAIAQRDGKVAPVSYRNYWDGWTAKVRLTGEIITAKLDSTRTAAIAGAADTFMAASRNSHLTGKAPRQTDPAIDQALATVFGASDLAAEPLPTDEIDKALQWLKTADQIGSVYILAGTDYDDFASVPQADAIQRRLRSNVVSFADEFGRYADFQLIVLSAIANAQMRLAAGAPAAQSRTDEIRALLAQAIASNFIALVYDGHNDAWRMGRLTTLGRAAPVAAKFLTREDARAVREQVLQTLDYFKDEMVRRRARDVADLLAAP
jgi:hypothetical protein